MRRVPGDVAFTHRACALLYLDNTIHLESEAVSTIAFPRVRFAQAVQTAIFVYGQAPLDDNERIDLSRDPANPPSPDPHVPHVAEPPQEAEVRAEPDVPDDTGAATTIPPPPCRGKM